MKKQICAFNNAVETKIEDKIKTLLKEMETEKALEDKSLYDYWGAQLALAIELQEFVHEIKSYCNYQRR